ncbi:MAG: hypothetical protein ACRDNZ_24310 [Streptosporangiaceae bacterium]
MPFFGQYLLASLGEALPAAGWAAPDAAAASDGPSMAMPVTAIPPAASCVSRPPGEDASRSLNRNAPMITPETGSRVSMMGRLADSALAW